MVPPSPAQNTLLCEHYLPKFHRQDYALLNTIPDYIFSGLAAIGLTEPEICSLLRIKPESLDSKRELLAQGRARLKHALRRAQIKQALKGNASMLIWLGKTYLGQKDQPDTNLSQHTNIVVDAALLSNLQQSYQSTLSDIRRTKTLSRPDKLSSDPVKQPALSDVPASYESGTVTPIPNEGEPLSSDPVMPTCYDSEAIQRNSFPINELASNGAFHSCDDETHPGTPTHPAETHTPKPKRLTSHISENFGESGKSGPVSRVAGKFLGVVALAKKYDRKGKLKHAEEAT